MWAREQTGGNIRGFQGTGAEEESERHSLTAEGRRGRVDFRGSEQH